MKTYYDILEISRFASKEVLNRAHKVLIKKYHPDLEQDEEQRKINEAHLVKINEAYEVLSDDVKRKEYDQKVFGSADINQDNTQNSDSVIDSKQADEIYKEKAQDEFDQIVNEELKKAQERIDEEERVIKENLREYQRQYLRSLGYKVKEPTNWKNVGILVLTFLIMLVLMFIIYLIPPIKTKINMEIDAKSGMGIVLEIIKGFYTLIGNIFKIIFNK